MNSRDTYKPPAPGLFTPDVVKPRCCIQLLGAIRLFGPKALRPHLNGHSAAFGRVIEGMEVLDAFEKEDVDGETPKRRLEIVTATVEP